MNEPTLTNQSFSSQFIVRVIYKTLAVFLIINLLYYLVQPLPWFGQVSFYNWLFPGRSRLPYSDNPRASYNLSLYQLDAMFGSHKIEAKKKQFSEFRVVLIGDSSTWGFLLTPEQTLAEQINQQNISLSDGRVVTAYNLGYPVMSLTKDLLILSRSMKYNPDMVIWLVTLESYPYDKQLYPPILQHNAVEVRRLINQQSLSLDPNDPQLITPTFCDNTLIGQRRALADLIRLQIYGAAWAATGVDQFIPAEYTQRIEDLPNDLSFHNFKNQNLKSSDLAFEIIKAGINLAGDVPVLIVNEPMFISHGQNSEIRYNYYYPRWAYDDYRQLFSAQCSQNGWQCLDLWNAISPFQYTNTAVHLSPEGVSQLAQLLKGPIEQTAAANLSCDCSETP